MCIILNMGSTFIFESPAHRPGRFLLPARPVELRVVQCDEKCLTRNEITSNLRWNLRERRGKNSHLLWDKVAPRGLKGARARRHGNGSHALHVQCSWYVAAIPIPGEAWNQGKKNEKTQGTRRASGQSHHFHHLMQ